MADTGRGVEVRASGAGADRRAGFGGLQTCGSVWSCPVCSAKILGHRQAELTQGLATWAKRGGSMVMLTLTARHNRSQSLRSVWDAVVGGWDTIAKGRPWRRAREDLGIAGFVRVTETTHGPNGWHVHLHVGVFLRGQAHARRIGDQLVDAVWPTWRSSLVRRGFEPPVKGLAVTARLWNGDSSSAFGDYFTKNVYDTAPAKAAMELARADLKRGRKDGHRTPFELLADIVASGDEAKRRQAGGLADDLDAWREWETASRDRRQMTWSRDLRSELGLDLVELTDDELASQELGTADDTLVVLDRSGWATVIANGLRSIVLDLAELDDRGAQLRRYLDARGIDFSEPVRVPARLHGPSVPSPTVDA